MFEERERKKESLKYNSKNKVKYNRERNLMSISGFYAFTCTYVNTQIYHICTHIYTKDNKETV